MSELRPMPRHLRRLTHGHTIGRVSSPTYQSWMCMLSRVRNPRRHNAARYRHVAVCIRWLSFENFLADMGERPAGRTLDRVDNSGDYEPRNCRWATAQEQARNCSHTKLTFESAKAVASALLRNEPKKTIAARFGVSRSLVRFIQLKKIWPDAMAAAELEHTPPRGPEATDD